MCREEIADARAPPPCPGLIHNTPSLAAVARASKAAPNVPATAKPFHPMPRSYVTREVVESSESLNARSHRRVGGCALESVHRRRGANKAKGPASPEARRFANQAKARSEPWRASYCSARIVAAVRKTLDDSIQGKLAV